MALIPTQAYYKLDESSGNAADATGNGYTLTNNGTTTYTTGKINNGGDFGASNSTKSFSIDSATPLGLTTTDISTAFSVACWMNQTTSVATVYPLTILCKNGSSRNTFGLVMNNTSIEFFVHDGSYNQYSTGSTCSNGTWFHYAVTYDGTNFKCYVNGSLVLTQTRAMSTFVDAATGGFGLGAFRSNSSSSAYWSGLIDEVGVWKSTLSGSDISSLYNGGTGIQYPFSATTNSNFLAFM